MSGQNMPAAQNLRKAKLRNLWQAICTLSDLAREVATRFGHSTFCLLKVIELRRSLDTSLLMPRRIPNTVLSPMSAEGP